MAAPIVLCAIDFTETSVHALKHAIGLCGRDISVIHVLHVCEAPDVRPGAAVGGLYVDAPTRLQEIIDEALKGHGAELRERVRPLVRKGVNAAAQIVKAATDLQADLIVLATHGRRGFQRLMVGSVAEEVVRTAPCSVTVVRPKQP